VALWIDNEEPTHLMRREWAQEAWDAAAEDSKRKEKAVVDLADRLKEWVEDNNPLAGEASMYADLIGAAFSEIDYYEIAEGWIGELI